MSGSLLQQEYAADSFYGFPMGTMAALGQTESSQGANLGSIGNVFQVKPATAANPGYGLGQLNGNSPMSAGSYLYALEQGPAGGNLSTALQMYHGGAGNPTPYSATSPIAQLVPGAGGSSGSSSSWLGSVGNQVMQLFNWGNPGALIGGAAGDAAGLPTTPGSQGVAGPFSQMVGQGGIFASNANFMQWFLRGGILIVGAILLIGALILFRPQTLKLVK